MANVSILFFKYIHLFLWRRKIAKDNIKDKNLTQSLELAAIKKPHYLRNRTWSEADTS